MNVATVVCVAGNSVIVCFFLWHNTHQGFGARIYWQDIMLYLDPLLCSLQKRSKPRYS